MLYQNYLTAYLRVSLRLGFRTESAGEVILKNWCFAGQMEAVKRKDQHRYQGKDTQNEHESVEKKLNKHTSIMQPSRRNSHCGDAQPSD